MKMQVRWLFVTLLMFGSGCSKGTKPTTPQVEVTPPAGSRVLCHLDCSGNQRQAYGATEEEARAAVQEFVSEACRPEDGQFFIFCEPVE